METERITQEPRRSGRIRHEPERYGFFVTDDPSIVLVDQDEAMESEMQSMYDNQVWTLVDPPQGAKIIECKWIFKDIPTLLSVKQ